MGIMLSVHAQPTFPTTQPTSGAALPEPVYWSQQLFLIPYKWDSGSTATGASAVKLYLSRDRGQTWQEISDAKPEVQFFNYHAPCDGEYWFSMRTIDSAGRAWPDGPHQAELRVIVDTQNPMVTSFNAQLRADGTAAAAWQASDPNISNPGLVLQYRIPNDSAWRDVPNVSNHAPAVGHAEGRATWQVPKGTTSFVARLVVRDKAGNGREAGAEALTQATPAAQLASSSHQPPRELPPLPGAGWRALPATASNRYPSTVDAALPPAQPWPSDGESPVPLGSPRGQAAPDTTAGAAPLGATRSLASGQPTSSTSPNAPGAQLANDALRSPFQLPSAERSLASTQTASLGPRAGAPPSAYPSTAPQARWRNLPTLPRSSGQAIPETGVSALQPRHVQHINSLDFEIGYDVDTAGTMGVTRVELWGTSNGGGSWQRLSVDTDNHSPILAAVPAPGDYGLKIVVETAGGIDPVRPRPGDRPEMLVRIDTTPPVAKLTGISQGTGAHADHLMVQWQPAQSLATDEKASLAYSNHPSGPWVTAAANIPNNGRYAWRLARHLPRKFYVRLEVRDQAGNVAGDQTQVPVEVTLPTPSGRLGDVRAVQ